LATALQAVVLVVKVVWNVLSALVDPLFTFGAALKKLLSGDMDGATKEMLKLGKNWGEAMSTVFDKVKADSARTWTEVQNLWGKGTEVAAPAKGTRTMGDFKPAGQARDSARDTSRMGQWEAELSERRAAIERLGMVEGQYREMSKAEELKYWADLRGMQGLSDQERIALSRKAAETEMGLIKQGFEVKVATLQAEAAAYKSNTGERLRIEREIQSKYQQGTKEYEASAKKIVEIERQAAEQERAIGEMRVQARRSAELQIIALEEQTVQMRAQLGVVSQEQVLSAQMQFEARRNAIAEAALQERLRAAELDPDRNPVEIAKIHQEMEALEMQHQQRMAQIKNNLAVVSTQPLVNSFRGAETSISASIQAIINRTMTLRQAVASAFKGMAQSMIQALSDYIAKKITVWATEKTLTLLGIGADAAKAGAGAAASQASIPVVGPMLAIAAMAATFSAVMGMKSNVAASAAGGFDVPGSINPITQLHAKEMVLPAKHADVIRQWADHGGAPAPAAGPIVIHTSGGDFIHKNDLAKLLKQMKRDFVFA
jgi:hypothetical protein